MNERLKELYSDAAIYAFDQRFIPGPVRELQEVITEKFAELIVRECAKVAFESDLTMAIGQWGADSAILKHFGIKE